MGSHTRPPVGYTCPASGAEPLVGVSCPPPRRNQQSLQRPAPSQVARDSRAQLGGKLRGALLSAVGKSLWAGVGTGDGFGEWAALGSPARPEDQVWTLPGICSHSPPAALAETPPSSLPQVLTDQSGNGCPKLHEPVPSHGRGRHQGTGRKEDLPSSRASSSLQGTVFYAATDWPSQVTRPHLRRKGVWEKQFWDFIWGGGA